MMHRSESPTPMDMAGSPEHGSNPGLQAQPTSFVEALDAVPQLFEGCINSSCCAIRDMRMVSKHANKIALRAINSYTLTLGASGSTITDDLHSVGKLLCCTGFRHLIVSVFHPEETSFTSLVSPEYHSRSMLQIRTFVASSLAALHNITRLDVIAPLYQVISPDTLDVPHNTIHRLEQAINILMGQLIPECLQLQEVSLDFDVVQSSGLEPLLQQLRFCCPCLVSLELALNTLSSSTLNQLHNLLPTVSSLVVRNDLARPGGSEVFHLIDFCTAIADCSSISKLDMCGCFLAEECYRAYAGPDDEDIWEKIPPGITELYCHAWGKGPQAGVQMQNLRTLWLGGKECPLVTQIKYSHQLIHNILWACPSLINLILTDYDHSGTFSESFEITCDDTTAPFLIMLTARMQAGLLFCFDADLITGIQLYEPVDLEEMSLQQILQALPPIPCFTSLTLLAALKEDACLESIARVFPNLQNLEIAESCITDEALNSLLPCPSVTKLEFYSCSNITHMSMFLIENLPVVEQILWNGCGRVTEKALHEGQIVLQRKGFPITCFWAGSQDPQ